MSSTTESVLSPTELQNFWQTINTDPLKPEIAALMELLQWFRGDIRVLGSAASFNQVGPSTSLIFDIQPPDNNEEWEILAVFLFDNAHIDATDTVQFTAADQVAALQVVLQQSQLQAITLGVYGGNQFGVAFPNRDTTVGKLSVLGLGNWQVIARRKDKTTPYLSLRINYSTTATAGTRQLAISWIYRRRRVV